MRRARGEEGQVTAFVVVFAMTLLAVTGLVLDGGLLLSAKRQAADTAEQAARAGAQAVDLATLRSSGDHRLDAVEAVAAANAYLRQVRAEGSVTATTERVTVTVTHTQQLRLLPLVGLNEVTVTGTGAGRSARGINEAEA